MKRARWGEALLLALFAAIVCFQVFVPPALGMADNGDYARVSGRFALGPWHPDPSDQYSYLTREWIFDRQYHWVSDDFSSELFPVSAAVLIGWLFNSYHFDIRLLGAVHALLWAGCFAVFLVALRSMRGWARWAAAVAALFVLTDANYVAFFNSFYRDAAAFLFLGWAVALWLVLITRERASLWIFVGFSLASALCVMSKAQHVPLGIFLFGLGLVAAFSFGERARRLGALALASIIPLGACAEYLNMPAADARMPQYAVVFQKILERSRTPEADLKELGLEPEFARFVGHGRDRLPDARIEQEWWNQFLGQANRGRVLLFHLRHPWRTAAMMYWDLKIRGADRRMSIFGKYDRASGYPPQPQARSFWWWTAFRSALLRWAPWHVLVWFAAVFWIAGRIAIREWPAQRARVAVLCLALALMALLEFAVSSLSDAGETDRHLFLFHVLTDFTILCAAAWGAQAFFRRREA